jgi:tetratricopeptide (TPR) repeat protein
MDLAAQVKNPGSLAAAHWIQGCVLMEQNRYEQSRKEFDLFRTAMQDSNAYAPDMPVSYEAVTGLLDVKSGRLDSARARLSYLESLVQNAGESRKSYGKYTAANLRAEVLIAEDSLDRAVEVANGAPTQPIPVFSSGALVRYNLPIVRDIAARALAKKGEMQKAVAEYERITAFDPQSSDRRIIFPKHLYQLGRLLEQTGQTDIATEKYRRFLDAWKDADTNLPEVLDARQRIAKLARKR